MSKGRRSGIGFVSSIPRRGRVRPRIESLEDRLTPAVQLTYSGAGSVLGLLELVPGSTPAVTVSEVAGHLLRVDLGGKTFDAASTSKIAGLTYEKADSPTTSTFATLDISTAGNVAAVQATLPAEDLAIASIANASGGIGGLSASARNIAVSGLDLSAAPGGVATISLTAASSLTVAAGTRLDAGGGKVALAAGLNADGTPASQGVAVAVADAGFETPVIGDKQFKYDPTGSAWTFVGNSGISGNGSPFTGSNPNAPEGVQVALIQGTSSLSQPLTFGAGAYTVSFQAAQRASNANFQTFQLTVDGVAVGSPFRPAGTAYQSFTSEPFVVAAGSHTIGFVGLNPNNVDATVFVDAVAIASAPTLTVGGGATVVSSNAATDAITLRADSMDIQEGSQGTFVGATTIVSGSPTRRILGPGATQQFLFDPSGNLFVLDSANNNIQVIPAGGSAPSYTLKGLDLPNTMAFDASGNLYVGDQFNVVYVYAPGAVSPTSTITGVVDPTALAFDASGNLYVANFGINGNGTTVFAYAPGGTSPSQIFNGVNGPTCMALDAAGNLYVGNTSTTGTNSVSIFAPGATLSPTRQLDGIKGVTALAFDAAGNLYVAGGTDNTVSIFAPGASTPFRVLTGFDNPSTLLFDAAGNLVVGNFGADASTVMFFRPGATTPASTLSGFGGPIPLIYDTSGNLYVGTGSRIEVFAPMATAGGIVVRTARPSVAIHLGVGGSGLSLSGDELSRLYVTPTGTITFGDASQTGDISLQDVDTLPGGPNVSIQQSPTGAGGVHFLLDNIGNVALDNGAGDLTVVAGTSGILSDNRGGSVAVIQTTGDVTFDTTGPVGTFSNTLGFAGSGPQTLTIGQTYAPTGSVYVSANVSLVVGGIQANNAPVFLYAGTDLTIVPGAIVNAGTGKLGLLAGYDFTGLGNSTAGTLTIGGGAGVVSSNSEDDAITLQGINMVIATGAGGATIGLSRGVGTTPVPVAGGVVIQSGSSTGAINLGTSTGSGLNLSNAELAQIVTVASGTVTIGQANYRGVLTFSGATPITTPGASLVVTQRPGSGGSIVLDGTSAAALSAAGSAVSLAAGTGGISALGTNPSLSATGTVTLDTTGPIGSAANRILIASAASPSSLVIGAGQAPAGAVYLGGLGGVNLGGLKTNNALIDVTTAGGLSILGGATISAGNALIRLGAGLNPDNSPSPSGGAISFGSGSGVVTTNATTSAILLRATDLQIDTSANPATIGGTVSNGTVAPTAGGLVIRTARADAAMNVGGSGTGLSLSNAELARMFTTASGTVTFGDATRTGTITFSNATPITTTGANLLILQSTAGAGSVVLDGTAGTAIRAGTSGIQILAGTGGISALGQGGGLGTTGPVTLDTTGPIGSAAARVRFDAGLIPGSVLIGSKRPSASGVYLGGLSGLTLGNIRTADATIDVTAVSALTVAPNATIDAGKGKVSLAAGRNPDQSPTSGGLLKIASNSVVVSDNPGRDAITLIGSDVDIDTSSTPAIVGARPSPRSTTPNSTISGITSPAGLVFDASGNLYVLSQGGTVIGIYAPGGTTLLSSITLASPAQDFVLDASGNLYVTSVTAANILVYAPGATSPSRTLTGVAAQASMAFDSKGNLFVADPGDNVVAVYKPASTTPDVTIPMQIPFSLAVDSADNVYVANLGGQVSVIAPDLKTVTTLTGASSPFLVALDAAGTLYVLNGGPGGGESSFVGVYTKGSTTPARTLTGLVVPRSMAVDSQGNVYVGNTTDLINNIKANNISVFAPGATTPTLTLTGNLAPVSLSLDSSGNLYVTNGSLNTISVFDAATPTPTAGGVIIAPSQPDAQISLGRSIGTGLAFADAQLANIFTLAGGGVTFGGTGYSGNIVGIGSINPHPGFDTLTLQTGAGTINTNAGVTIAAANLALIAGGGIGTTAPMAIDAGHLAFASASGPIRIKDSGDVTLTAVGTLAASSIPGDVFSSNTVGAAFTLLTSAGVSGQITYNGRALSEGSTFTLADGKLYKISYAGNNGQNITITRFELLTEPPGPRPPVPSISLQDGVLAIGGTNGDDVVKLVRQGGTLRVYASFLPDATPFRSFKLRSIRSAVIDLRGGDDYASVGSLIQTPVVINGGSGDDTLIAGGGRTVLIGGGGKDTLVATPRGKGSLIVTGTTSFDAQDDALRAIAAEWASKRPRKVRVANITGTRPRTPRLNGNRFLNAQTVSGDGARNVVTGSGSQDLLMSGSLDVISRRNVRK